MFEELIYQLQKDPVKWAETKKCFKESSITSRTILLKEGDHSQFLYFIKKGCLRLWFNNDGRDITLQFFFEGQAVASIESFMNEQPSNFTLESIEPCELIYISKHDFESLMKNNAELQEGFRKVLFARMGNYANLFLSRIKDSPQKRYEDLMKNHPEIIQRVPQHYIASYLGITPISLSRIRNRIR